jgi:hypothetical protein
LCTSHILVCFRCQCLRSLGGCSACHSELLQMVFLCPSHTSRYEASQKFLLTHNGPSVFLHMPYILTQPFLQPLDTGIFLPTAQSRQSMPEGCKGQLDILVLPPNLCHFIKRWHSYSWERINYCSQFYPHKQLLGTISFIICAFGNIRTIKIRFFLVITNFLSACCTRPVVAVQMARKGAAPD